MRGTLGGYIDLMLQSKSQNAENANFLCKLS